MQEYTDEINECLKEAKKYRLKAFNNMVDVNTGIGAAEENLQELYDNMRDVIELYKRAFNAVRLIMQSRYNLTNPEIRENPKQIVATARAALAEARDAAESVVDIDLSVYDKENTA